MIKDLEARCVDFEVNARNIMERQSHSVFHAANMHSTEIC